MRDPCLLNLKTVSDKTRKFHLNKAVNAELEKLLDVS